MRLRQQSGPRAETGLLPWITNAILVVTLVPLGSNSPAGLQSTILIISIAFAATVLTYSARLGIPRAAATMLNGASLPTLLFFPVFVSVQLWAQHATAFSNGPTVDLANSACMLVALAAFYLLVRLAASTSAGFRIVFIGIVVIGICEASYGLLNFLSGNETLLIYKRWAYLFSATGTLVSRNHFAYVMELSLPLALAGAILFSRSGPADLTASDRKARLSIGYLLAMIVGLGLAFSRSRMGIVSMGLAITVVFVADIATRPHGRRFSSRDSFGRSAIIITLATIVVAGFLGIDSILDRFLNAPRDIGIRYTEIWKPAVAMFMDNPIFGHGWGTFAGLESSYRSRPNGLYYEYSHNDYLQVLAETGVVGISAIAWMIILFVRRLVRTLSRKISDTERMTTVALAAAITSILLHSTVDFGLRIPGVAVLSVCVMALFSRATDEPDTIE